MDLLNPPRLDKDSIRRFADRASGSYDEAAVLAKEVRSRLLDRLQYIRHEPRMIADIGCGTGGAIRGLQKVYPGASVVAVDLSERMLKGARSGFRLWSRKRLVAADMERLPFASQSFDLVFSSLALPWCNDLKATLAEFSRIARPGALILFSSLGPGTLRELAQSWEVIDPTPRVHRFIDMHDVGDAMMAAGFSQPVVDAELIRMQYRRFDDLLDDLRNSGANNADRQRRRGLTTAAELRAVESEYRRQAFEAGCFTASFEIVYGHAWAGQAGGTAP